MKFARSRDMLGPDMEPSRVDLVKPVHAPMCSGKGRP
jgi:hypothetical protein